MVYNQTIQEKRKQYAEKNRSLQALQNETAAAIAIYQQYAPLINSGNQAIRNVQGLFEGWSDISSHFQRLLVQVESAEKVMDKATKIQRHLVRTKIIVGKIVESITLHQQSNLIQVTPEPSANNLLCSYSARRLGYVKPITLPTRLYSAYSHRVHASDVNIYSQQLSFWQGATKASNADRKFKREEYNY